MAGTTTTGTATRLHSSLGKRAVSM